MLSKILIVANAALVSLTGAAPAQNVSFGERLYQLFNRFIEQFGVW